MKIGIDAHAAESDGSGNCTYIRSTLLGLKGLDADVRYVLYATDPSHDFFRNFDGDPRFVLGRIPVRNPLLRIPVVLPLKTFRDGLDVLHVQYIAPPVHSGRLVATIHDLGFLRLPGTFSRFEAFRSRWMVGRTARRAAHIITGSEYSKRDIGRTYGLPPDSITIIPYGISPAFRPIEDLRQVDALAGKYGFRIPYILTVGRLNPRKNFGTLVRAFDRLKAGHGIPHELVIVGRKDYRADAIVRSVRRSGQGEHIRFTGYVPDEELPLLYAGADVFVYPSLFEGVGLPALEAMSCGTPVVASDTTSLKEIVGGAGLLVDPLDAEALAQAVSVLLSDGARRADFVRKGRDRAALFTRKRMALETMKVYRRVGSP